MLLQSSPIPPSAGAEVWGACAALKLIRRLCPHYRAQVWMDNSQVVDLISQSLSSAGLHQIAFFSSENNISDLVGGWVGEESHEGQPPPPPRSMTK